MNISPAGQALGFGRTGIAASNYGNGAGDMLRGQLDDETEAEKLRRKLGLSSLQSGSSLLSSGSPAMRSLLGNIGGLSGRTY